MLMAGCGLDEGERFGRPATEPGVLRVHVSERPVELDPARARTPLERAIARQLFSALVEPGSVAGDVSSLARSWEQRGARRLVLRLREDAQFSDGSPLTAHDVVWSWRRAIRPSTGADPRLAATIGNGAALAAGTLLRIVASAPVAARGPPYSVFLDETAAARAPPVANAISDVSGVFLPGMAVRVLDTNARRAGPPGATASLAAPAAPPPAASAASDAPFPPLVPPAGGDAVPLWRTPEGGAAFSSLARGEVATVIALVQTPARKNTPARTMLQLRAPDGAAGWASADAVERHVDAIGIVPVVHRGGAEPQLLAGPDPMAPVRATLGDESVVELLERGAPFSLVIDVASGKTGFVDSALLEDSGRERRWFLVETVAGDDGEDGPKHTTVVRGWVSERDLAFDPNLLDVTAVDEHTLEVGLAVDVERALAAFAEPAFRPVPARVVEESGRAWTSARTIVTSGPFTLGAVDVSGAGLRRDLALALVRSPTSFEARRAHIDRVELIAIANPTSALHLYRAGRLDVVLDGALPPDIAPILARASDWRAGASGGALVALEVSGFTGAALELRDVTVGKLVGK